MTDLSALTLIPANPDQVNQYRRSSCEEWGYGAPEDYYVEMWNGIDQLESGADGKVTVWLLMRRDSLDSLDFLSACMSFRREGLVRAIKTSSTGEDEVEAREATNYGIGMVYTPKQHRRQGYGKHMMQLLHWVLAPESDLPHSSFPTDVWGAPPKRHVGQGNAAFSILYSDIGADFYANCGPLPESKSTGWIVRGARSTTWEVSKVLQGVEPKKDTEGWKWLGEDDVKKLWVIDADIIKEEIGRPIGLGKEWEATCLPNKGVAIYMTELFRPMWMQADPIPTHWGICLASSDRDSLDAETMATWNLNASKKVPNKTVLTISRLRSSPERFEALLKQIAVHARIQGVENIEVWNLPSELAEVGEKAGGTDFDRQIKELPSIKWYGPEQITWIHNEKFCHC